MTAITLDSSRIARWCDLLLVAAGAARRRLREARAEARARQHGAVTARRLRCALATLDDHLLADIGLRRDQLVDPGAALAAVASAPPAPPAPAGSRDLDVPRSPK